MRPLSIPEEIKKFLSDKSSKDDMCKSAAIAYAQMYKGDIEVSIVMPAYNESENIVPTLASLCLNKTNRSVEIIVVNNNSSDDTESLVLACGVNCVRENQQGITFARNRGLESAKGKYILNADADTIYPEDWIEEMTKPLIDDPTIAITYGRFSFIPVGSTGRTAYFFFEYLADLSRWYNSKVKDEAVNVYGFNSGFRKEQCLLVDGFNHPPGTNEDGWLALKLRNRGFGKLHQVKVSNALVWTTDRRIQIDGGFFKGVFKRMKRILNIN